MRGDRGGAAGALAVVAGRGGAQAGPSRSGAADGGVLYLGLAILIYETPRRHLGADQSGIVGYVFIGVTFLCARRFGDGEGLAGGVVRGLVALWLMGADAYLKAPSNRVGYFAGYPITYGALVVGAASGALLFAYQRSRLLAAGVAAASAALLIFSESRSSWVAVTVMLVVAALLQARAGNYRALRRDRRGGRHPRGADRWARLAAQARRRKAQREDRHHPVGDPPRVQLQLRASHTIGERPLFGAGEPGFSAQESANKTNIGAIDNGYLSIAVDMGLVGLDRGAASRSAVALRVLGRCLRFGVTPRSSWRSRWGSSAWRSSRPSTTASTGRSSTCCWERWAACCRRGSHGSPRPARAAGASGRRDRRRRSASGRAT